MQIFDKTFEEGGFTASGISFKDKDLAYIALQESLKSFESFGLVRVQVDVVEVVENAHVVKNLIQK